MGKRGTNQAKSINVAVPAESIGYWADRLKGAGIEAEQVERFGTERLEFAHPCGIPYQIVGENREDTREPYAGGDVPAEHAIRGAYGTTTSVREADPMDDFLQAAFNCKPIASDGPHHQYEIEGDGHGRMLELVEEPDLPQGTWRFGEGTIHHHAFDVGTSENQLRVKDYIVGLGYTDVSDVKDRGYFFSVYLRTPGGALFELAYSTEAGFTIDESEDELGTHMCIPPHWEDRRSEIDQLEPIDTIEDVKA
jgi:glyoxalase family protein